MFSHAGFPFHIITLTYYHKRPLISLSKSINSSSSKTSALMPMPGVPPGDDGRDAAIIDWVATETISNSGLIYSFLFIVLSDLLDCNFFTIVNIDALFSRLAIQLHTLQRVPVVIVHCHLFSTNRLNVCSLIIVNKTDSKCI